MKKSILRNESAVSPVLGAILNIDDVRLHLSGGSQPLRPSRAAAHSSTRSSTRSAERLPIHHRGGKNPRGPRALRTHPALSLLRLGPSQATPIRARPPGKHRPPSPP